MLDKRNKKIAGVCAGMARYLDMDVTLIRVLWLAIAIITGVGFAQPITGTPPMMASSGNTTVPIGSMCTSGLSDTRPSRRAVSSPNRLAVHACADSWTVREKMRTRNSMRTEGISIADKLPQYNRRGPAVGRN